MTRVGFGSCKQITFLVTTYLSQTYTAQQQALGGSGETKTGDFSSLFHPPGLPELCKEESQREMQLTQSIGAEFQEPVWGAGGSRLTKRPVLKAAGSQP